MAKLPAIDVSYIVKELPDLPYYKIKSLVVNTQPYQHHCLTNIFKQLQWDWPWEDVTPGVDFRMYYWRISSFNRIYPGVLPNYGQQLGNALIRNSVFLPSPSDILNLLDHFHYSDDEHTRLVFHVSRMGTHGLAWDANVVWQSNWIYEHCMADVVFFKGNAIFIIGTHRSKVKNPTLRKLMAAVVTHLGARKKWMGLEKDWLTDNEWTVKTN